MIYDDNNYDDDRDDTFTGQGQFYFDRQFSNNSRNRPQSQVQSRFWQSTPKQNEPSNNRFGRRIQNVDR
ncbi:hypothetical protein GcM3_200049 [Golovinomyces cichoracearum]|uniref:Uncharacterized protein n=1 Tax=Golovinomyces cichoracearum TaxID=62708 RepID=A0A420HE60_9PEZI|nr:hypothetical protein GcM3_200049 [Golovinomyces cichoracearum]